MSIEQGWFEAITSRNLDRLVVLASESPAWVSAVTEQGVSGLMLSLYYQQEAVTGWLLPQVNPDIWEASALGLEAVVVEYLENEPELVNEKYPDGFYPLGLAAYFGRTEMVKLLLSHGADPSQAADNQMRVCAIHSAAANRDHTASLEIVRFLLEYKAEVNIQQEGGWTPLMQAASGGHTALVELLLEHGADQMIKSDDGRTALDLAEEKGYSETAALLKG